MPAEIPKKFQDEAEEVIRELVRRIRKVRVTFYTEDDIEIVTNGPYDCRPGDVLSVPVLTPEMLEFIQSPETT